MHNHIAYMKLMDVVDRTHQATVWSSNMMTCFSHAMTKINSDDGNVQQKQLTDIVVDDCSSISDTSLFSSNTAAWASNFLYYSLTPISANAMYTSNTCTWTSNVLGVARSEIAAFKRSADSSFNRFSVKNESYFCVKDAFTTLPQSIWDTDTKESQDIVMDVTGFVTATVAGVYTFCFKVCFESSFEDGATEHLVSIVDGNGDHRFTTRTFTTPKCIVGCGSLTTHLQAGQGMSLQVCPVNGNAICSWKGTFSNSYFEITKIQSVSS